MSVDWSELPPEIIETISQKTTIYADYIRFRCVCRNWLSSTPKTPLHLPPQLPWLILSQTSFYDIFTDKTNHFNFPLPLHRTRFIGSSHGWLIILDQTPDVILYNPVTCNDLFLPPLNTFPNVVSFNYSNIGREYLVTSYSGGLKSFSLKEMCNFFIRKIVLSSSPTQNDDFVAFAIVGYTDKLAFCKKGYDSWLFLSLEKCYFWEDVVYHNGLFYVVSKEGVIAVCDVDAPRVSIIAPVPFQFAGDIHYVVFSGDDMLLVTRFLDQHFEESCDNIVYRTLWFEVFKMDWNEMKWQKIETLGDRALFVGGNSSLCFSVTDFVGCRGNGIHFTDDYSESNDDDAFGNLDFGIFSLSDKSIELFSCFAHNLYSRFRSPLPIWVTPNPC